MDNSIAVPITDQEKLSFFHANEMHSASEKSSLHSAKEKIELRSSKEKTEPDQWMFELQEKTLSFTSLMAMINKLIQEFTLMIRNINMRNTEDYIRQRLDEFAAAVNKIIKSIDDMAFRNAVLGAAKGAIAGTIATGQIFIRDIAYILASAGESLLGVTVDGAGAWWNRVPQMEGELGQKEKTLTDNAHTREQNGREWFKEASRLFATLTEFMASIVREMQKILRLERH